MGRARRARFVFAVKASRFLTHMKKLKDPEEPLDRLFSRSGAGKPSRTRALSVATGVEDQRRSFRAFLDALPRALAPRGRVSRSVAGTPEICGSWSRDVALCLHDMRFGDGSGAVGSVRLRQVSRRRGEVRRRLQTRATASVGRLAEAQRDDGCDVYAYFNNDIGGHAPRDALMLRRVLEEHHEAWQKFALGVAVGIGAALVATRLARARHAIISRAASS